MESVFCIYVHLMKLIGQKTCDSTLYCQFLYHFFLLRELLCGLRCIFCLYVCKYYWPVLTHKSEIWTWTKRDVSRLLTVEMEY